MKKAVAMSAVIVILAAVFALSGCEKKDAPAPDVVKEIFGSYRIGKVLFSASRLGQTSSALEEKLKDYTVEIHEDSFEVNGPFDITMFRINGEEGPKYSYHRIKADDNGLNDSVTMPVNSKTDTIALISGCDAYVDIGYTDRELTNGDLGYRLYVGDEKVYAARFDVLPSGEYRFQYIISLSLQMKDLLS